MLIDFHECVAKALKVENPWCSGTMSFPQRATTLVMSFHCSLAALIVLYKMRAEAVTRDKSTDISPVLTVITPSRHFLIQLGLLYEAEARPSRLIFKNSVCTSKRAPCFSITKIS
jgi:hypothetical protein